jgi:nitrogen regulatory protein PII-like uncharacterized protein
MPHFGLMDPEALGPERASLQRARLHIRAGKRRLRQGKISAGIVTLYDALAYAMDWYVRSPEHVKGLKIEQDEDMKDERTVFKVLNRSGVLDGTFDYETFNSLLERALEEDIQDLDYTETVKAIESVMTQLGVMPFDEGVLPPEDPSTF